MKLLGLILILSGTIVFLSHSWGWSPPPSQPFEFDSSLAGSDTIPPPRPKLYLKSLVRGGPHLYNGKLMRITENVGHLKIRLQFDQDPTLKDNIGIKGLLLKEEDGLISANWGGVTKSGYWVYDHMSAVSFATAYFSDSPEARLRDRKLGYAFVFFDRAGNQSEVSDTLWIELPGD